MNMIPFAYPSVNYLPVGAIPSSTIKLQPHTSQSKVDKYSFAYD